MTDKPVFLVIDPALKTGAGHYAEYIRALQPAIEATGYSLRVAIPRSASSADRLGFEADRILTADFDTTVAWIPRFRSFADLLRTTIRFRADLRSVLGLFTDTCLTLFVPTVDQRFLIAWWWWSLWPHPNVTNVTLLLRYSFADGESWRAEARWASLAFWLFRHTRCQVPIRMVTDSDRLAAEYVALGAPAMSTIGIPHTAEGSPPKRNDDRVSIRYVTLGDVRPEKGFELVASAIRLAIDTGIRNVEFVLHAYAISEEDARARDRAVSELPPDRVRMVTGLLPRAEYLELLQAADVVILPYSRSSYRSRTSGPFVEAVGLGRPVIVTSGTWMSDQLEALGSGVTFSDGDAQDLVRAIVEVRDRYADFRNRAEQARETWLRRHSAATVVAELLDGR